MNVLPFTAYQTRNTIQLQVRKTFRVIRRNKIDRGRIV